MLLKCNLGYIFEFTQSKYWFQDDLSLTEIGFLISSALTLSSSHCLTLIRLFFGQRHGWEALSKAVSEARSLALQTSATVSAVTAETQIFPVKQDSPNSDPAVAAAVQREALVGLEKHLVESVISPLGSRFSEGLRELEQRLEDEKRVRREESSILRTRLDSSSSSLEERVSGLERNAGARAAEQPLFGAATAMVLADDEEKSLLARVQAAIQAVVLERERASERRLARAMAETTASIMINVEKQARRCDKLGKALSLERHERSRAQAHSDEQAAALARHSNSTLLECRAAFELHHQRLVTLEKEQAATVEPVMEVADEIDPPALMATSTNLLEPPRQAPPPPLRASVSSDDRPHASARGLVEPMEDVIGRMVTAATVTLKKDLETGLFESLREFRQAASVEEAAAVAGNRRRVVHRTESEGANQARAVAEEVSQKESAALRKMIDNVEENCRAIESVSRRAEALSSATSAEVDAIKASQALVALAASSSEWVEVHDSSGKLSWYKARTGESRPHPPQEHLEVTAMVAQARENASKAASEKAEARDRALAAMARSETEAAIAILGPKMKNELAAEVKKLEERLEELEARAAERPLFSDMSPSSDPQETLARRAELSEREAKLESATLARASEVATSVANEIVKAALHSSRDKKPKSPARAYESSVAASMSLAKASMNTSSTSAKSEAEKEVQVYSQEDFGLLEARGNSFHGDSKTPTSPSEVVVEVSRLFQQLSAERSEREALEARLEKIEAAMGIGGKKSGSTPEDELAPPSKLSESASISFSAVTGEKIRGRPAVPFGVGAASSAAQGFLRARRSAAAGSATGAVQKQLAGLFPPRPGS